MKWKIDYSREANKFIEKHNIRNEVKEELKKVFHKMKGVDINIDLQKLTGDWKGYYRLRKGRIRIIFEISKNEKALFVPDISKEEDLSKTESIIDMSLRSVMCAPLGRRYLEKHQEQRPLPYLV